MAISNRRFTLATVVLPLFMLAMSGLARANIIVVNSTNGGSVPAPACTLQDAVAAARTATAVHGCNAGSGNDTIEFSVTGTIATAAGLTLTNNTLNVDGPAGGITIDAGGNNPIFLAFGGSLTLKDLTLTNGFEFFGGGAIRSTGSVTIDDCTFVNNTAGNLALGGNGGAIFAQGGPVTITNSTFVNNTAVESTEGGFGGAIFNDVTQMSITNSTFSGNHAFSGGALFNTLGEPSAFTAPSWLTVPAAIAAQPLLTTDTISPTTRAAASAAPALTTALPCIWTRWDCRTMAARRKLSRSNRIARRSILFRPLLVSISRRRLRCR
jgi:hypothetical protein